MAFPIEVIENWVQHEVAAHRCLRCGLVLAQAADGIVYVKRGASYRNTPRSNWSECA